MDLIYLKLEYLKANFEYVRDYTELQLLQK